MHDLSSHRSIYDFQDIYIHTPTSYDMHDIGKYKVLSDEEGKALFERGFLGYYYDLVYRKSKKVGLMCTEESFKITNEMRKVSYPRLTDEDYIEIFSHIEEPGDAKLLINDEELYVRILHDIKYSMHEEMFKHRGDEVLYNAFQEAFLFDALCNLLAKQLTSDVMRPTIMNRAKRATLIADLFVQLREKIKKLDKYLNPTKISYVFNQFKSFTFKVEDPANPNGPKKEVFIPLKKFAINARGVPQMLRDNTIPNFTGFNSGILLHGMQGTGKSGALMYIAQWAQANDWVVLISPGGFQTCQGEYQIRRHTVAGVYLHPELTLEFLKNFRSANQKVLAQIPVNLERYGAYDGAGIRKDEPVIYKVVWIEKRQVFSNYWQEWIGPSDIAWEAYTNMDFGKTAKMMVPEPKNLLEIVDAGISTPFSATNCMYEILE